MPEFLFLLSPSEALERLKLNLTLAPIPEEIDTSQALGRVTFSPVVAPQPLPAFPRSTVDGYAVRAVDTHGASESLPAFLKVGGEIGMGIEPDITIKQAECALIHTGGMLPSGSDAVVMLEHTQSVKDWEIEVYRSVASGENVLKVGEDVREGEVVIPLGTRLRPVEIGGLMALGMIRIQVARCPHVGIISSGDEVIPPNGKIQPGQVRDINSYSLSALIKQAGGIPIQFGIVPDNAQILSKVAKQALADCDLVVITAGSSASSRDLTAQVIDGLGKPGVLVHGVNVRPGKPTILAACSYREDLPAKPVIGLPGNPVSALVIARLFIVPLIDEILGHHSSRPKPIIQAQLKINLPSQAGREDWIPVRFVPEANLMKVEPVFGKSNLIFSLVRADGLIHIPKDATGVSAGEIVDVLLLE